MTSQLQTLDANTLETVSGGQAPIARPALPAPPTLPRLPGPTTPPFVPPTGMAPPKYSAGWWDIFRKAGLGK